MEKTKIHKKMPELAHLKNGDQWHVRERRKSFNANFSAKFFIFLKSPKVINFLLEVLEEIVTSGDSCKSKSRCCRLIPTYLPTYVVCGPIVDSFGSNAVGKTCLIKVCSRTSDDNRVTKILFTFQLNWSSWWSNFLSRIFLFYVVTHVGIEKHSSATHGLLFAKLKSKCNVNALLKKAMYFLKMDQPRPLFAYFRSFQAHILIEKNCRLQLDSNSDRRSRMWARWPLDHHHGLVCIGSSYRKRAVILTAVL